MKLNRYNGFILESAVYDLILESKLKYMNDFARILTDIKSDSQDKDVITIAQFLLKICDKDMKLTQNFIGVDKVDKVSFVPDNKVVTDDSIVSVNVNLQGELCNIVVNNSIITRSGIPKEGLHQPNRESELPSNTWTILGTYAGEKVESSFKRYTLYHLQNTVDPTYHIVTFDDSISNTHGTTKYYRLPEKSRGAIKIGRFVNRILDIWFTEKADIETSTRKDFTPAMIEKFVNAYSAKVLFLQNVFDYFDIVKGEDIRKWYLVDNYDIKAGQLGSSCMRYSNTQSFLNIYVENPQTCQLLIFFNEAKDKINGRALLWTDVDGKKYMDRIYTSKDNFINLFRKWADENNYGDVYDGGDKVKVKVLNKNYEQYPYMDSLCYFKFTDDEEEIYQGPGGDEEAHLYSNNNDPDRPYYYIQSTSGGFSIRT